MESIPGLHKSVKNTISVRFKTIFFGSKRKKTNIFVPQLMKEQRKMNYSFLYYQRNEDKQKYLFLNYRRNEDEAKYSFLNKGTKAKRSIRSSTIDNLTLLSLSFICPTLNLSSILFFLLFLRNRNMIGKIQTRWENSLLGNRKTAGKNSGWWEISLSGRKKVCGTPRIGGDLPTPFL